MSDTRKRLLDMSEKIERLTAKNTTEIRRTVHYQEKALELLRDNERLRALLEMWLEVNDWGGPIGGLRHNTMLALQHKDLVEVKRLELPPELDSEQHKDPDEVLNND